MRSRLSPGFAIVRGVAAAALLAWMSGGCTTFSDVDATDENAPGSQGGGAQAGQGGSSGAGGGAAGQPGAGGKAGSSAGQGGSGGKAGAAGSAGASGLGGASSGAGGESAGGAGQAGSEQAGQAGSEQAGQAGSGGAEAGGAAGEGGAAGQAGEGGSAGAGGDAGQGGSAGEGGNAGQAGQGGSAQAGSGGSAGASGSSGQSGSAGSSAGASGSGQGGGGGGSGASSGQGGKGGSAGSAGSAGQGGSAGASGSAGQGGSGGQGGAGGSGGSAGATGSQDTCPGQPIALKAGSTAVLGDTTGLQDNYHPDNGQCSKGNNRDAVYAVTAEQAGVVTVSVDSSDFSPVFYLRSDCLSINSELGCSAGAGVELSETVKAGETLWVFVEGAGEGGAAVGAFTLHLTLAPSMCGNGVVDPGEECDDSNGVAGDGCSGCKLDAQCSASEPPDLSLGSPFQAPQSCTTVNVFPAELASPTDHDWICVQAKAGQTITAQTYTGAPGQCSKTPHNTLLELFKGKPGSDGGLSTMCGQSSALVCNDDISGQNPCSRVLYGVKAGEAGEFCLRASMSGSLSGGFEFQIPEYGVVVTVK